MHSDLTDFKKDILHASDQTDKTDILLYHASGSLLKQRWCWPLRSAKGAQGNAELKAIAPAIEIPTESPCPKSNRQVPIPSAKIRFSSFLFILYQNQLYRLITVENQNQNSPAYFFHIFPFYYTYYKGLKG